MENTVTISVAEYDQLREIKKKAEENTLVICHAQEYLSSRGNGMYAIERSHTYHGSDETITKLSDEIQAVRDLCIQSKKNLQERHHGLQQQLLKQEKEKLSLYLHLKKLWWFNLHGKEVEKRWFEHQKRQRIT